MLPDHNLAMLDESPLQSNDQSDYSFRYTRADLGVVAKEFRVRNHGDVGPVLLWKATLFDGHRLCEITRLVDVSSQGKRSVVRKKLQRQREDERCH